MKKKMSLVAIAAFCATGFAFMGNRQVQQWNVDHPSSGTPGIYFLTADQVKNIFCPGVNNLECAYLIKSPSTIIKKP